MIQFGSLHDSMVEDIYNWDRIHVISIANTLDNLTSGVYILQILIVYNFKYKYYKQDG